LPYNIYYCQKFNAIKGNTIFKKKIPGVKKCHLGVLLDGITFRCQFEIQDGKKKVDSRVDFMRCCESLPTHLKTNLKP
jgi:hypothetical protein